MLDLVLSLLQKPIMLWCFGMLDVQTIFCTMNLAPQLFCFSRIKQLELYSMNLLILHFLCSFFIFLFQVLLLLLLINHFNFVESWCCFELCTSIRSLPLIFYLLQTLIPSLSQSHFSMYNFLLSVLSLQTIFV